MANSSEAIGQTTTSGKRPHSKIPIDGGDPPRDDTNPAQDAKPAFDLIEPGAVGGDEVKIHIGMGFEPAVLFRLVGVEILAGAINLLQRRIGQRWEAT